MALLAGRRCDLGKRHKQPESALQVTCVRLAREQGLLVCGQAGGARYLNGGRTANAQKAKGVDPGIPDLLVLEPGGDGTHGLAVEFKVNSLKVNGNKLSAEQRAWFARGRAKRWRFCCILSSKRYSGTSYLGPLETCPWVLGGCTYLVGS